MAFKGSKINKDYLTRDILLGFIHSPQTASTILASLSDEEREKYSGLSFGDQMVQLSLYLANSLCVASALSLSDVGSEGEDNLSQTYFNDPLDGIVLDGDLCG